MGHKYEGSRIIVKQRLSHITKQEIDKCLSEHEEYGQLYPWNLSPHPPRGCLVVIYFSRFISLAPRTAVK
jgi:hypothetical protein